MRTEKRKLRSTFGAAGAFPFHRRSLLSRSEPSAARKLSVVVGSVNIGKKPGRYDDAQVARVNAQRTSLKIFFCARIIVTMVRRTSRDTSAR
jgi:hypothetical protein